MCWRMGAHPDATSGVTISAGKWKCVRTKSFSATGEFGFCAW